MATKQRSPERQQLADSIDNLANVRRELADAKSAIETAFGHWMRADREHDELIAQAKEANGQSADHILATLRSGGDVAELTRPADALAQRVESKRQELEAWENAQLVARTVADTRQSSLSWAEYIRDQAVRAVIAAEIDPAPLLAEVKELKRKLADKSRLLQALANQLPPERRRDLEMEFARNPPDGRPASGAFLKYVEALATDADAKFTV
jgi:hypothetical protein